MLGWDVTDFGLGDYEKKGLLLFTVCNGNYHQFWAENGTVVVGEVSLVNDDNADNRFYDSVGRFPAIEEDEPPLHLLCNEYPNA